MSLENKMFAKVCETGEVVRFSINLDESVTTKHGTWSNKDVFLEAHELLAKDKPPFDFRSAYAIQRDDLNLWAKILKPEVYVNLVNTVLSRNANGYKSPYDVCRGSDIACIVNNLRHQ